MRATEDAAADEGGDDGVAPIPNAKVTGSGNASDGSPGKTPRKSMPALRAELAHRLALHYVAAYRCAAIQTGRMTPPVFKLLGCFCVAAEVCGECM